EVAIYANGAWLGRANTVLTGLGDAITGFAREAAVRQAAFAGAAAQPPLHLVQRPLFNTREGYGSALVTGVAELIVQQTLLMGIACACLLIGLMIMLYYAGFMFWYQDFPRGGNFPGMLVGGLLFVGSVVALGMFIASFCRTRERAYQLILVTSLPYFFQSNLS